MPRGLFGRNDLMAAHSKSMSSYRIFDAPVWALESRPNRCLQPTKSDNRHFRDYPSTGHAADMPKSTLMTQSAADQRVPGTPGAVNPISLSSKTRTQSFPL